MRLLWTYAFLAGCGFGPAAASGDAATTGSAGSDAQIFEDARPNGVVGARRKPITIHGPMITGTQTDFPVWIDLVDSDIAANSLIDGTDIFFTAANGAPLDYERQGWNPTTKRLQAWVRVPTLAHNTDTVIYVEYGDLAKTTAANPAGTFRASFAAVWHLDDPLVSAKVVDATGTHDGTAAGLAPTTQVAAQLGGGIAFDGSSTGVITFTNPITGNTASTVSAWVNQGQLTHTSSIVAMGTNGSEQARFLYGHYGAGATIAVGQFNDDWQVGSDISGANWVLIHWVMEGQNKKHHVYRNGVEISGSPHTMNNAPNTAGTMGMIGNAPAPEFGSPNGMNGTIDEVRIATVIRDAAWIATEYANQNAPSSFYSVGAEQAAP